MAAWKKLKSSIWRSLLWKAWLIFSGNQIIFRLDHQDLCKCRQHRFNEQKSDCLLMKYFWVEQLNEIDAMRLKPMVQNVFVVIYLDWQGQSWAKGSLDSLITALLIVWTVGHMDAHLTDWITKPVQVSGQFLLATYQFECRAVDFWVICNTRYCMWKSYRRMAISFSKTCKRGSIIFKLHRFLNVASELGTASISTSTFPFWFRTFMKKNKNKIKKTFKILK